MPSGRVHTSVTAFATGIVAGGLWWYCANDKSVAVAYAAGGIWAMIASPDLDVDAGFIGFALIRDLWKFGMRPLLRRKSLPRRMAKVVFHFLARLWRIYWRPYALLVPHRSALSHAPVVGTLLRLAYASPLLFAVGWMPPPTPFVMAAIVADTLHAAMDFGGKK